jgi:hypothetical protein
VVLKLELSDTDIKSSYFDNDGSRDIFQPPDIPQPPPIEILQPPIEIPPPEMLGIASCIL